MRRTRITGVLWSAAAGAAVISLGVPGGAGVASAAPAVTTAASRDAAVGAADQLSPAVSRAWRARTVTAYVTNYAPRVAPRDAAVVFALPPVASFSVMLTS